MLSAPFCLVDATLTLVLFYEQLFIAILEARRFVSAVHE